MLYEIYESYPGQLFDFHPAAPASDRQAWEQVDEIWKDRTIRLGERYLGTSWPSIAATDFMDFSRTGDRRRYEEKYFAKRRAFNALVLAECAEDQGRFTDDIINGIFSLCEESAWQLPPHNSYVRDAPQLPLPDTTNPVLDLFACETGAVLATAYYLLKDKLDKISPFLCTRIMDELQRRIFTPYLERHFWWMGDGRQPMNNWTIWCTQNVLLAVFLTDTDAEYRKKAAKKACISADYFLAEYGEDGCCDEGAQYYRHAGLCLFHVLEILNAVTDHAFAGLYRESKIKNIAAYILNVHVDDRYYVNFADCSPVAGRAGIREFLFAKRTGNTEMAVFAAKDYMAGGEESLLLPEESNLFYRLENGMHALEIKAYVAANRRPAAHRDIFYPSVGLFIVRDETYCLAVKAGDNADSHNHNDTGSFTAYKNGQPFLIDVGVKSYTKKTFSPERYEIWTMQSAYHNLPTVNGVMQADGKEYRAADVCCYADTSSGEIEMDISAAYPPKAGIKFYHRKAALYKGKEIVIRDSFMLWDRAKGRYGTEVSLAAGAQPPVIWSLMTCEKPVLAPEKPGNVIRVGNLGQIQIVSGSYLKTETIPVTDQRLKLAWKHEIYRILIAADETCAEIRIR